MIAYGIMLGLTGIIMLFVGGVFFIKKSSFTADSEEVNAAVIEKHSRHGKNGRIYELKVAYSVNGVDYTKYLRTTRSEFEIITQGDTIELLYKPNNPKNVLRKDALDPRSIRGIRIVLYIGLALCIIGLALYFMGQ